MASPLGKPSAAKTRPARTTRELKMSVEKCSASASRAGLLVALATRYSALLRLKSMTMERMITP